MCVLNVGEEQNIREVPCSPQRQILKPAVIAISKRANSLWHESQVRLPEFHTILTWKPFLLHPLHHNSCSRIATDNCAAQNIGSWDSFCFEISSTSRYRPPRHRSTCSNSPCRTKLRPLISRKAGPREDAMTGILDVCVPSRRRERRRQRQLAKERLHSRFGDLAISAPNQGGWNELAKELNAKSAQAYGSPDTERTLVNGLPELDQDFDGVIVVGDSYALQAEAKERNTITIKIPLPWSTKPSKKSLSRSSSTATHTLPIEAKKRDEANRSPPPPSASPPVIYKPFSTHYMQEMAKLGVCEDPSIRPWNLSHSSPSQASIDSGRTHNLSPAITILSPVSEDFAKGVGDISLSDSPGTIELATSTSSQHTTSPPLPAIEYFSQRLPSPPTLPFDPCRALASHPPERYATPPLKPQTVGGQPTLAEQPCVVPERPSTAMSIRCVVPERPGTAMSTRVVPERPGTAMSTRYVVPERPGTAMSSHSIYHGRSASRGPSEDRIGTTRARSASRGPGLEKTGYMRSSSREPAQRRAMSREPVHRRAASRDVGGAGSYVGEAFGRRASSRGPASGARLPSRAASAEPLYRRPIQREDFFASDTTSTATSIEDLGRKPSASTSVSSKSSKSSPNRSRRNSGSRDDYTKSPRLFDESDSDSSSTSGNSGATKGKKFEKLRDRIKTPVLDEQDMVPNGDELWSWWKSGYKRWIWHFDMMEESLGNRTRNCVDFAQAITWRR